MSLQTKVSIAGISGQNLLTGMQLIPFDITGAYDPINNIGGYGTPNPLISATKKTRFLISSYLTEQNFNDNITYCNPGVEYTIYGSGSNTVVIDTKIFHLNDTFIIEVGAIPTIGAGLTIKETGRFAAITTFLPTSLVAPFSSYSLTPSECGINQLIFPDSIYTLIYESYSTEYSAGTIAAGTYIVKGTPLQTITISGINYNVGEVFIKTGSFTFTGSATICLFESSCQDTQPLYYYAYTAKNNVLQLYVSDGCNCAEEVKSVLDFISSMLFAIIINFEDDLKNDISGTQTLLNKIVSEASKVWIG